MSRRPNILILMPDQFRADVMGCAGHPVFRTPNLDRLAQEGTHFTHAYATSPVCMPARASVATGRYPHNHHVWSNGAQLADDEVTYANLLQEAGYCTALIGKSHLYVHAGGDLLKHEVDLHQRGFEYVHETTGPQATLYTDSYLTRYWKSKGLLEVFREDYRRRGEQGRAYAVWPSPVAVEDFLDSYIGARAVEFLSEYDGARPFLLNVGFGGPHPPFDAPGEYGTMYDPDWLPAPLPAEEPDPSLPEHVRRRMLQKRDPSLTPALARKLMANYGGKVTLIDHWIGQILERLEARGWADNTLVIFWSDHGEMGGDHQMIGKSVFYEASVRVPLILRWPNAFAGGRRSDALVEQIDLFDTIIEAAGLSKWPRSFGRSLLPLARGEVEQTRDAVFGEVGTDTMIRTREYKYVADDQGRGCLLYNMQLDPDEQRNLIGSAEGRGVEGELRDRMLVWHLSTQARRKTPKGAVKDE